MNLSRFQNLCGVINFVLKCIVVGCIISLIGNIGSYVNGNFHVSKNFLDGTPIIGSSSGNLNMFTNTQLGQAQLITRSFMMAVFAALIFIGSNVLLDIWLGKTPFSEKQTRRMFLISTGIIVISIVRDPLYTIILSILSPAENTFSFSLGNGMMVFGLVMLCMTGMVKYGVELQKLSDDTV